MWFKCDSGVHLNIAVRINSCGIPGGACGPPSPSREGSQGRSTLECAGSSLRAGPCPRHRSEPGFPPCIGLELQANCELGAQLCPAELAPRCRLFPTDMYINSWHLLNQI